MDLQFCGAPPGPDLTMDRMMFRNAKVRLSQVGACLLLQAGIATGGLLLQRWIVPESPCSAQLLVL
jgi:hypothetical protein